MRYDSPETPYVVGGLAVVIGAAKKYGGFNNAVFPAVLAIGLLIVLASFSAGTAYASIVRAFGILFALAAVSLAVRQYIVTGAKK